MAATEAARLVFLCSGGGGNFAFIQSAIELGLLKAKVVAVLSDRWSGANKIAERLKIDQAVVEFSDPGQKSLMSRLTESKPDLIVTNVHRILGASVVEAYKKHLINLHYSILPAFSGTIGRRSLEASLAYGCKIVGVTVHWVVEDVDAGPPIAQCAIPVSEPEFDLTDLMNVVFRCGGISLLASLQSLEFGGAPSGGGQILSILGRQCLLSGPASNMDSVTDTHVIWDRVRALVD